MIPNIHTSTHSNPPLSDSQRELAVILDSAKWISQDIPQSLPLIQDALQEKVITPISRLLSNSSQRNCDVVLDALDALHKYKAYIASDSTRFDTHPSISPLQLCQWMLDVHSPSSSIRSQSNHLFPLPSAMVDRENLLDEATLKIKHIEDRISPSSLSTHNHSSEDNQRENSELKQSLLECKTLLESLVKEISNLKTQIGE